VTRTSIDRGLAAVAALLVATCAAGGEPDLPLNVGRTASAQLAPSSGSLDLSFGVGGRVASEFDAALGRLRNAGEPTGANAVAIQPDGRVVVAGSARFRGEDGGVFSDFVLARYEQDGSLDATFGTGGVVRTDFGGDDYANAVAMQPDGRIVVAGTAYGGQFVNSSHTVRPPFSFALARYHPDGAPDLTFGTHGVVTTDLDPIPFSLAILEDADRLGDGSGLGAIGVFGALELEIGHLALDHARVAALATGRQARGGDLAQQAVDKRGASSGLVRPRWKRPTARRRMRSVPVKLRRSGSTLARAAASTIVRRTARWASARP
jgi:uncharacterized delta-60 repeat protein